MRSVTDGSLVCEVKHVATQHHHNHHHQQTATATTPASASPPALLASKASIPASPVPPLSRRAASPPLTTAATATASPHPGGANTNEHHDNHRRSHSHNHSHSHSHGQSQDQGQDHNVSNGGSNHMTSLGAGQSPQQPQHKRVYQACIPCRRRKVRCDLGSVDNPHDPPCMRCRRESKECFFSATRRKRKNDDDADEYQDEYIIRNGRKRHYLEDTPPVPDEERKPFMPVPLTPGGSAGRNQPLRRTHGLHDAHATATATTPAAPAAAATAAAGDGPRRSSYAESTEDSNAQVENLEAQSVMRKGVYGPHDALDLLYKAATDSPHSIQIRQNPPPSTTITPNSLQPSVASAPGRKPPHSQNSALGPRTAIRPINNKAADPIDPRLLPGDGADASADVETRLNVEHEPGYQEALAAWARFRFVRAGWFTKEEAIKYIVYYYEYLSPMTPVSPPTFRSPASHTTLLTEEPILAVTLLTIASRYHSIRTTGGHCRSHAIHEELWRYLRRMVERCLWGQEAFGGGFCGSGADESQTSSTAPWRGLRKGSLRTLGTIESLMILTEWHPRALHFPPEEAIDELMLPSREVRIIDSADDDVVARPGGNVGGQRIESWLEPAWRSDRMCWMLLSNALGLAYELGVFDDIDELLATNAITRPEYEDESYRLRAIRIKRLLLIYLTQLAGRLGWTNMVPESIRKTDPVFSNRRPTTTDGATPGTNHSVLSTSFSYVPDTELDDQIIQCWVGISNAMHLGNERLFRSRKHTTEIIQSGSYTRLLKEFQPILREWWAEFEPLRLPEFIRYILTIEYEYVRIYVNSLALQAVVERCTTNATGASSNDGLHVARGANGNAELSPQTQNYLGNLPLGHLGRFGAEDQECVKEVVSGCRNLLRIVVDGLFKGGYLKHAPVRTYFRIISGAMFLLKTFALGAPKSDVETSISLLDRTVHALRTCVVDDVHLGTRFGDLLESLTTRLRDRFKFAPTSVEGKNALVTGDLGKGSGPNGHSALVGLENGFSTHPVKFSDGLTVPERSSTPSGNISATPFDMSSSNFPFPINTGAMFGAVNPSSNGAVVDSAGLNDHVFDTGNEWPADEMWYLPPGAGLFQNVGGDTNVTMTDQGVNVRGVDLLEFMAMDPPNFGNLDTSGY
ncbi:transcriptional activator ARO80 [Nemania sp. FL0916]|nr:transcriptional activator ARO80 [Nemania sp. FL0916]